MAIDRTRQEHALLGGGGAWSGRERALAQALLEIGQTRNSLKFTRPTPGREIRPDSDPAELTEFFDAAVYWGYSANLPRLAWYADGDAVIPWEAVPTLRFDSEAAEYEAMLALLKHAGLNPIVLDFGSVCWPGVTVMKVFIPELTQACVPAHPYLGHPRFYECAQRLGLADRRLSFSDLNITPVPFP